ncbi:uncharacterized protein LOC117648586 [Thrips palmi]|uniref:Uncharacterized protein LOC117648586 n=1 Tax=Thrips palmi TaxID=161013 RepID=A0A6P8Z912_THRPL|nr:uncharacterized protein LOC117648586 [Thrips palmi]
MSLLSLLVGVLLLNGVGQVTSKAIHSFAGPYIAFVHTVFPCPSLRLAEVSVRASHFNPLKPFDKQTVQGYARSSYNVTDNFLTKVTMAVRSNNQWKENAFVFTFPNSGCTAIRDHLPDLFRVIAKHSGASMNKKDPCLIPGGSYKFKNESVSWTAPHFPVMPYGRYKFHMAAYFMNLTKAEAEPRFCVSCDCEIVPKPIADP